MNRCPFCTHHSVEAGTLRTNRSGIIIDEKCKYCHSSWQTPIRYGKSNEAAQYRLKAHV